MAGSAQRAVKKAVIDGLADHFRLLPDFNGSNPETELVVAYGYQFGETRLAQHLYAGRSRGDTPPAAIRPDRNFRDEVGRFDLNILLRIPGFDLDQAEERMDAIGAEVETWLADRKSNQLGVTGLQSLRVESWRQDYAGADSAVPVLRAYTIRWTARLT